jgi:hypothetical protein
MEDKSTEKEMNKKFGKHAYDFSLCFPHELLTLCILSVAQRQLSSSNQLSYRETVGYTVARQLSLCSSVGQSSTTVSL